VLPVLAERQVAALGSDGTNDTAPSTAASSLGVRLLPR